MARESIYQARLVKKLECMFPGCHIIRNDPGNRQGIPDLLILYNCTWAMLEVKKSRGAPTQPNQPFYVEKFGEMSFAAFIYPEIEDEVLDDLQSAFGAYRQARIS